MAGDITTYSEFWPFYLREHSNRTCRVLHYIGSSLAILNLAALFTTGSGWYFLSGLISAYACAWIGHFVFEKNRPATFKYPLWSFVSDWRMVGLAFIGRLGPEMERAEAGRAAAAPEKSEALESSAA